MRLAGDIERVGLSLGGTTYGWLHRASLEMALRSLADVGIQSVEIVTAAPHWSSRAFGSFERHNLSRLLDQLGLRLISVNPGYLDVNLMSPSTEFRDLSEKVIVEQMELAGELGAPLVVLMPGRRHRLSPAPKEACRWTLERTLERLLARAEQLEVTLALETGPTDFLGTGDDLLEIVNGFDDEHLGIAYDCANVLAVDDPAAGVKRVASRLRLAHVSDTWRDNWAHTSPGRGEVDFTAFAAALDEIGFSGPTIFELADGEDPGVRLADDFAALEMAGWSRSVAPVLPARSTPSHHFAIKEGLAS